MKKKQSIWFGIGLVLIATTTFVYKYYLKEKKLNDWHETTEKHIEYYENGQPSLIIISDTTTNEKYFSFYYQDGEMEKEYLKLNGKIEGPVNFYYSSGEIEYKQQYMSGLQNGPSKWFYKDGSLKEEIQYVNGKKNGIGSFYNRQGVLKAQNAFMENKLYWKLINTIDSTGSFTSKYETYAPLVELNKDTLTMGDSISAQFYIPLGKTKFDKGSILQVKYDVCLETDSLPEPRFSVSLNNGIGNIGLLVEGSGLYFLYGYLISEESRTVEEHEYFLEEYYVIPD